MFRRTIVNFLPALYCTVLELAILNMHCNQAVSDTCLSILGVTKCVTFGMEQDEDPEK